jgi:flagellar protein FliT
MVYAAQSHDWDTLIALEQRVADLRDALKANDENLNSVADIERKRFLIQQILQHDAEIRRYTEPWMEQVRQFLGAANRRQQVVRAYGAV